MNPSPAVSDAASSNPRSKLGFVAWATLIGTSIEWYDFFAYGVAAALVFNKQFFPNVSPLIGTLLAFSTYGVGFAARPVGGVVFAHFGDRVGRKAMLVLTLLLMGGGTFLIGVLPGFAAIGFAAPVLLVLLRILQGVGVGGEWGAAALMAVEHAPPHRKGFFGSWPQTGVPVGLLVSNLLFLVLSATMSDQAFQAWGWRVPFLASILLVVVGLAVRLRVAESPEFQAVKAAGRIERQPVVTVLRTQPKDVLRAAGLRFAENGTFYIHTTFVLSYGTTVLALKRDDLLFGVIIASAVGLFSLPFYGALSDRVGRRPVILFGSILLALMSWPYFWGLQSLSLPIIYLVTVICINVGNSAVYGPQPAFYAELFEPKVRYSGASIGAQGASVFAGGLAPLVATALLQLPGGYHWIAAYMTVLCLITVVTALLTPDSYRQSLRANRDAAAAPSAG